MSTQTTIPNGRVHLIHVAAQVPLLAAAIPAGLGLYAAAGAAYRALDGVLQAETWAIAAALMVLATVLYGAGALLLARHRTEETMPWRHLPPLLILWTLGLAMGAAAVIAAYGAFAVFGSTLMLIVGAALLGEITTATRRQR